MNRNKIQGKNSRSICLMGAICVTSILSTRALAGTFVPNVSQLWPGGVVHYAFYNSVRNVGECSNNDEDTTNFCDPTAAQSSCPQAAACDPLTKGWCIGGDSAEFSWPACDTANGTADCDAAGVTGGQCVVSTMSSICIAQELWDAEANLTFIEWGCQNGQPTCPGNACVQDPPTSKIAIQATTGVTSYSDNVGRDANATQNIYVKLRTGRVSGIGQAHELGHALGLYHEQQRPDRNTYLDVDTSLVTEGLEGNFDIEPDAMFYPRVEHGVDTPFDFDSLLMYRLCRFSICGDSCSGDSDICENDTANCRPMEMIWNWTGGSETCCGVPSGDPCVGQRNHLSEMDKLTMKFLYPQNGWLFVDWAYDGEAQENGLFQKPYRTFTEGANAVVPNGKLIVQPGFYNSIGTYSNAFSVEAPIGPVTLGG